MTLLAFGYVLVGGCFANWLCHEWPGWHDPLRWSMLWELPAVCLLAGLVTLFWPALVGGLAWEFYKDWRRSQEGK